MPTATLTSKGQVTIPREIRDRLGIHPGDRIEFVVSRDGTVELRPITRSVRDLAGLLRRPGRAPVTLEEMQQGVFDHMAAEDERTRNGR